MAFTRRRYGKEEFTRHGDAVYKKTVRPRLTSWDDGKFAAIDIDSGDYEVDSDKLSAYDRLRSRVSGAQI